MNKEFNQTSTKTHYGIFSAADAAEMRGMGSANNSHLAVVSDREGREFPVTAIIENGQVVSGYKRWFNDAVVVSTDVDVKIPARTIENTEESIRTFYPTSPKTLLLN